MIQLGKAALVEPPGRPPPVACRRRGAALRLQPKQRQATWNWTGTPPSRWRGSGEILAGMSPPRQLRSAREKPCHCGFFITPAGETLRCAPGPVGLTEGAMCSPRISAPSRAAFSSGLCVCCAQSCVCKFGGRENRPGKGRGPAYGPSRERRRSGSERASAPSPPLPSVGRGGQYAGSTRAEYMSRIEFTTNGLY